MLDFILGIINMIMGAVKAFISSGFIENFG